MKRLVIEDYFMKDGVLKKTLAYFEYRREQLVMAKRVYSAFEKGGLLIVEAQTGTGKTLAYLIPAILSGKKTVISTGTKNLQEQIFKKDIPFLQKELGLNFRASCMKGSANYICYKKFKYFMKQGSFEFKREFRYFGKVVDWLETTDSGDIEELTDIPEKLSFIRQITSSSEQCTGQKCPNFKECFITRMRERSLAADIIIINHHLFFADLAVKEKSAMFVVPHYQAVIFDEAHQLEDTASSYFGVSTSNYKVDELSRDIKFAMSAQSIADKRLTDILSELVQRGTEFFNQFSGFARFDKVTFKLKDLLRANRQPVFHALEKLLTSLDILISHIQVMNDKKDDMLNCLHRAKECKDELMFVMDMSDDNYVYWCEVRRRGSFVKATPIDVSGILEEALFNKQERIVLTSATLAADNGFEYIKERLGITRHGAQGEDAVVDDNRCAQDELILPSPFDFSNRALCYLPRVKCEPNAPGFARESAGHILELITACRGRTFALFTSNRNMNEVYGLIKDKIPFRTFIQGEKPKSTILKEFIKDKSSVLFATMSFWEGVDVQGDALVCVIIDKLPFASPGDPLVEAKINLIKHAGGNPFFDFQLPQAVITLKQGLGRLIRKTDDYGILCILDKRLVTKGYGRKFKASIPNARTTSDIRQVTEFLTKIQSQCEKAL